ncbi:MAG TPA: rhodanese-like domain-containing protein [Methylophaga sp.]|nr:rhodanese-like domain-containing protein [Methylophaga sp.]
MTNNINANELFKQHAPEDLCLVDVRTTAEVRSEALPGIITMPLDELDADKLQAVIDRRSQGDQPIYLICQSGKRAQLAADKLAGKLRQPLIIIEGGMNAIKQTGISYLQTHLPIISLERQVRIVAGALVFLGVILGLSLHNGFFGLSAVVGAGLMFSGITDSCSMGILLAKAPWNR